jgi:hypothetical protein
MAEALKVLLEEMRWEAGMKGRTLDVGREAYAWGGDWRRV